MKNPNPVIKLNRVGGTFLISVALYLFLSFFFEKIHLESKSLNIFYELFLHMLLFLVAMTGAHILEKAYLWHEIAEFNRDSLKEVLTPALQLVGSSNECGIEKIYVSRKEATSDILTAIRKSEYRVWMAGIAFSESLKFKGILRIIKPKIEKYDEFSFRVLMTDVFKSPAVFRSFIEGNKDQVAKMIKYDPFKYINSENPYFNHKLFIDFYSSFSTILNDEKIQDLVKYHAHNPNCWLVVVDNTAYFQPYTLGKGESVKPEQTAIGPLMPVFKFQKNDDINTFSILIDHFVKLWKTSTSDFYDIKAKYGKREDIVNEIFKTRSYWLNHVYGALFEYDNNDLYDLNERRKYNRRPCLSDYTLYVAIDDSNYSGKIKSEIKNISKNGLSLILDDTVGIKKAESIYIDLTENENNLFVSNEPSLRAFVSTSKCKFDIKWKKQKGEKIELGLVSNNCEYDPNKPVSYLSH